jgi:hypothetical protein
MSHPTLESAMKVRLAERAIALALASLVTAGMLGAIDGLAGLEDVSPAWAAAVMSKVRG